MTTHHMHVADGRIVRRHSRHHSHHRKRLGLSPIDHACVSHRRGDRKSRELGDESEEGARREELAGAVRVVEGFDAVAEGPWGGSRGTEFYDGRGEIVSITVHYNNHAMIKLQVTYEQSQARFHAHAHGGAGGETTKISLADYPAEFLKQVVGTTAHDHHHNDNEEVTSLTFITNKQQYGPYDHERGKKFQTPATLGLWDFMVEQAPIWIDWECP